VVQEPRIEIYPRVHLVGLGTTFASILSGEDTARQAIGALWGRLHERVAEITAREPGVFYGWTWFLPPGLRSREDELGYVAGVEVASGAPVPEGMVSVEASEGLYAVFEHRGPLVTFHALILWIYREWLPSSPYRGNGRGDLECYDEGWKHDGEDSVFEFRVGVEER